MEIGIEIGPAREDEIAFVKDAFKESQVSAVEKELTARLAELVPGFDLVSDRASRARRKRSEEHARELLAPLRSELLRHYDDVIEDVLATDPVVLVARNRDEPSFLYGFLIALLAGNTLALHYTYTKRRYRRCGAMSALLSRVLELVPDGAGLVYCTRSSRDEVFERFGFEFCDLRDVLVQAARRSA